MNDADKVFVVLDVKNILRVCKCEFGPSYRINYKKLMEVIARECAARERRVDITAVAYISLSKRVNPADISFAAALGRIGFIVKKQIFIPRVKARVDDLYSETDWCPGIAADMMEKFYDEEYNHFVVVTGDNDFRHVSKMLMDKGSNVGIYSFSHPSLYKASANYACRLSRHFVFSISRRNRDNIEEFQKEEEDDSYREDFDDIQED